MTSTPVLPGPRVPDYTDPAGLHLADLLGGPAARPAEPPRSRPTTIGSQETTGLAALLVALGLIDQAATCVEIGDLARARYLLARASRQADEHLRFALDEDTLAFSAVTTKARAVIDEVLTTSGPPQAHITTEAR